LKISRSEKIAHFVWTNLEPQKKNSVRHPKNPRVLLVEICIGGMSAAWDTDLRFRFILHHFGWIDAPHTQNFEILNFFEKNQESKQIKHHFGNICKNARWLIF
jgi:hypothetical protein